MALISMLNLYNAVIGCGVVYVAYYIYWQLTVGASRRRMIKEHGCQPAPSLGIGQVLSGMFFAVVHYRSIKEGKLLEKTAERFAEYGNTWHLNVLGSDVHMTIEPENVKSVLALQFKKFGISARRIKEFKPLIGEGIFLVNGVEWQHSREMLRPSFTRSQVADLDMIEEHVAHMIQLLPRDGSTVNLADYFFKLTMDSATMLLLGESTNSLVPGMTSKASKKFTEAFGRAQAELSIRARSRLALFITSITGQLKQDTKTVHAFVDAYVEKAFEQKRTGDIEKWDGRYIFLYELTKQTDSKYKVRSELLHILLAGRDTTAALLTNVFWELSRKPAVWAKLRKEVDELRGERPSYEQLKDMKYLKAVLNEALRLYPVVPGNSRDAFEDCVLPLGGGPDGKSPIFIPKGGIIVYSVWAMGRNKQFFGEDALEFRPERWETLRPGWEYLPFNGGPRICIGQQYSLIEASYVTIRLMQDFKGIESRDPDPWMESITFTVVGKNGAKVGLTPA